MLRQYFAQFPGPHRAVVESTGRWYWLRDLLVPAGVDLELAHAKLLKAIAEPRALADVNVRGVEPPKECGRHAS